MLSYNSAWNLIFLGRVYHKIECQSWNDFSFPNQPPSLIGKTVEMAWGGVSRLALQQSLCDCLWLQVGLFTKWSPIILLIYQVPWYFQKSSSSPHSQNLAPLTNCDSLCGYSEYRDMIVLICFLRFLWFAHVHICPWVVKAVDFQKACSHPPSSSLCPRYSEAQFCFSPSRVYVLWESWRLTSFLLHLMWKSASGNKRAHTSKWFKLSKIKFSTLLN